MTESNDAAASELAELAALHQAAARRRAELGATVHELATELTDREAMKAYARQAAVRGARAAWDATRARLRQHGPDGQVAWPARPWRPSPGPALAAALAFGACLATGILAWQLARQRTVAQRQPSLARQRTVAQRQPGRRRR